MNEDSQNWPLVPLRKLLKESRIPGTTGVDARKITVKLYGKGAVPKNERQAGSSNTKYYVRRAGQLIYGKLDFLNGAFAIIPDALDGYESTQDLPAFDISPDVHPRWLIRFLTQESFYKPLQGNAIGSRKARRVNPEEFLNLEIRLPPKPIQEATADIIDDVDAAITAGSSFLDQLQTLKRKSLSTLLTRKTWPKVVMSDVAQVQTGLAKGKKPDSDDVLTVSYLRVANVQDGFFDLTEIKAIEIARKDLERYRLRYGDVLLTEGGDADKLGRGQMWTGQVEPCIHQNHVFAVRPNPEKLLPQYLAYLVGSDYGKRYFAGAAKQSTNLASINSTQLKAFPCLLPSLAEQQEIIDILSAFDERIRVEQERLRQLHRVKAVLAQQLLAGRLPLPEFQAVAT